MSVVGDPKQLDNLNPAANDMTSEQFCTVTEIKKECFDMKLDAKNCLSKAKRSVMRGGEGMSQSEISEERILYSTGGVTLSAATQDDPGQRPAEMY